LEEDDGGGQDPYRVAKLVKKKKTDIILKNRSKNKGNLLAVYVLALQ
jgi:hypothetical protein